jgi:hypothetical protein
MQHEDEGDKPFSSGALDALTAMRRSEERLTRLEAQLEVVEQAVVSLRELVDEEAAARQSLVAEHGPQLEAETRAEYAELCFRIEAVRADYDRLAGGLDETMHRHAARQLDEASFAAAQRESGEALRTRAAELARLDQLRLLFEKALGVAMTVPAAPRQAPAAPPTPVAVEPPPIAPPVPSVDAATREMPVARPSLAASPEPPAQAAIPVVPPPLPVDTPVPTPPPLADVPFPPPLPTPIPLADSPEAGPAAVLVEAHEASSGAAHAVHDGLQIGRAIENELRVLDPSVSRQHATIVVRSGAFVLEDLQSQNGTFVNGERIRQRVLCDGDRIGIGEAAFIFRMSGPGLDAFAS